MQRHLNIGVASRAEGPGRAQQAAILAISQGWLARDSVFTHAHDADERCRAGKPSPTGGASHCAPRPAPSLVRGAGERGVSFCAPSARVLAPSSPGPFHGLAGFVRAADFSFGFLHASPALLDAQSGGAQMLTTGASPW